MRIAIVRQSFAIVFFNAGLPSNLHPDCIRSSSTHFPAVGLDVFPAHHPCSLCLANMNVGERLQQPKDIQQPQHYGDYYDGVQDRLDGTRHGNETIHQPQQNSDNDQGYDNLK
jgi:hypothetical protein